MVQKRVHGQWSSWSAFGSCSCQSGSSIQGLRQSSRKCNNPRPQNGGRFCSGVGEKYKLCSAGSDVCSDDLSTSVEKICRQANLDDASILPFGDAQNTSSCQIQCFKAGSGGGSVSNGWFFPDGTNCLGNNHFCIKEKCQVSPSCKCRKLVKAVTLCLFSVEIQL